MAGKSAKRKRPNFQPKESLNDVCELWLKLEDYVRERNGIGCPPLDLSTDDIKLIAEILGHVVYTRDARDFFYKRVKSRPTDIQLHAATWNAVFEMLLDIRFDVPADTAREAAKRKYGLKEHQFKRALSKHRDAASAQVGGMSDDWAKDEWEKSKRPIEYGDWIDLYMVRSMGTGLG